MKHFDNNKRSSKHMLQKLWLVLVIMALPLTIQANYVSIVSIAKQANKIITTQASMRATLWNAMGLSTATNEAGKAMYGGGDFSLNFVASAPDSYDHTTGGGAFDDATTNTDIVESLEGGDFTCGDIVTFLTEIKVDAGATGAQTIDLDYSFLADATGQPGVALSDILTVKVNYGAVSGGDGPGNTDSGISDDGGSVATLTNEHITGDGTLYNGNDLVGTVTVTDLEAGETVIVRMDVLIACDPGSSPTGNLQGAITAGLVIDPEEDNISVGNQTVPFKNVDQIQFPDCVLAAAGPVCAGATTAHTATSDVDAATYTWTISGSSTGTTFVGGGTTKTTTAAQGELSTGVDVVAGGAGTYTLSVVISKQGYGDQSCSVTVVVNAIPEVYTLSSTSYCAGDAALGSLTLSNSETGVSYQLKDATNANVQVAKSGTGEPLIWTGIAAGTGYYVVATGAEPSNCQSQTIPVNVTENPLPDAKAGADKVLTCTTTSINLSGSSATEGVTYTWVASDGGNIVSGADSATPLVDAAGTYTLTVTTTATGCTNTDVALVTVDNTTPNVSAGPDMQLTCITTEVMLSGSSTTEGVTYSWNGPNGYTSNSATPTVNAAGTYTLTVTNSATGCAASDMVEVTKDETLPEVSINKDPYTPFLTCNIKAVVLYSATNIEGGIFLWTGPNGFTANIGPVYATVPGTYTLTVTNPENGCSATATTVVSEFYPDYVANAGPDKVLTCTNTTVTLEGSVNTLNYEWTTEDGHIVSSRFTRNIVVDKPGTYILRGLDIEFGCGGVTDTVVVTEDKELPHIMAQGGTLDCNTGTLQLMGSSTTEGVAYSWSGPMGYTSSEQNPTVTLAGEYTLTVTDGGNGCHTMMTVTVHPQPVVPEPVVTCYEINFENNNTGFVTSTTTGAGVVNIFNRKRNVDGTYETENHAAIFNTLMPTGDDSDLYTEDWGHVLIINQDLNPEPNDNPWGGEMTLDFSAFGPVKMTSLKALDFDVYEDNSWVYLYDGAGNELYKVQIHSMGNNSKQEIDLGNTKGVMKMKVVMDGFNSAGMLAGSGAIDGIKFCVEEATEDPCTKPVQTEIKATAFPMPFSDRTTVEFTSNETQEYVVQLFDSRGRMLRELKAGTVRAGEVITIDVDGTNLPNGMYMAHIIGKAGIKKTVKLINRK
ncbi:T9SS type A sorting domain-containing protein [Pontibacter sp. KCTC 32443]|uniref:T9SS type A sorting domain-containing protein n=1 Tax=Pontibacter TaxID=323449 RepID=UPI00164D3301|nr:MULTISPECIES: T9SS type A sorting domain-containing protein [Pontibacter]MBC5774011.1 T9SS type A sorting domain-containing protein [Pontibacter sp. KCTC 32443]